MDGRLTIHFSVEKSFIYGLCPNSRPLDEHRNVLWDGASEQTIKKVPDEETCEFADEQQDYGPEWAGLVEAQGDGYDVADDGNPCGEGQPDAVFVNLDLLFGEGFRLDLEPFLNPFPSADPAYPVGEDASEPVAEGADNQAADRVSRCGEDGEVERIGAEREDCGGEEGADEEAEEA